MELLKKKYNHKINFSIIVISIILSITYFKLFNEGILPSNIIGYLPQQNNWNQELNCCGGRTSFYPYFKYIISLVSTNFNFLHFFQVLILIFSLSYLAYEFYLYFNSKFFSLFFYLSLILNVKYIKLGYLIGEEGLYIFTLNLILISIMQICRSFSLNKLFYLIIFICFLACIRPIGYSMFPVIFIIIFFFWKKIREKLFYSSILFIIPIIFIFSTENYLYFKNEEIRTSTVGTLLFGKIFQISKNKPNISKYPELSDILYTKGKNVRKIINQQKNFETKQYLRNIYHNNLVASEVDTKVKKTILKYSKLENNQNKNIVTLGAFKEYFLINKIEYLKFTFLNYLGIWSVSEIMSAENALKLRNYTRSETFNKLNSILYVDIEMHLNNLDKHTHFAFLAKILMNFIFIISISIFFVGFYKYRISRKKNLTNLDESFLYLILPLIIHIYFVSVVSMTVAETRFVITYFSLLMLVFFIGVQFTYTKINYYIKKYFKT